MLKSESVFENETLWAIEIKFKKKREVAKILGYRKRVKKTVKHEDDRNTNYI